MTGEIPKGVRPELSKRDALKLLVASLAPLVGAACGISQVDTFPNPAVETAQAALTDFPSTEAAIPFIEATDAASKRTAEIVAISSQESLNSFLEQTNLTDEEKAELQHFGIMAEGMVVDFVAIPEARTSAGEVAAEERLAMRVGEEWHFLVKSVVPLENDGDRETVLWQFSPQDVEEITEPTSLNVILWYRQDPAELNIWSFAPPEPLATQINFERSGYGFEIPIENIPEGPRRVLAREVQIEVDPFEGLIVGKDLLWNGEPAPLGVLGEEDEFEGWTEIMTSGVILEIKQEEVLIGDKAETAWTATVYFGKNPKGQDVIARFFFGFGVLGPEGRENQIFRVDMKGRSGLYGDKVVVGNTSHSYSEDEIDDIIEDIQFGNKQYAFNLLLAIDSPDIENQGYLALFENNAEIVRFIKGESILNSEEIASLVGYIYQIWMTPDTPVANP